MVAKSEAENSKIEVKPKATFSISFKGLKTHLNLLYVVFKKTFFFDLYNPWKLLLSIVIINMVSFSAIITKNLQFTDSQSSINEYLGMIHILFSSLVGLSFIIIFSSASLISEEFQSGTMILLVSKPISRAKIVWGKYLALWFYSLMISTTGLGLVSFIAYLKYPFYDIFTFFETQFLFSLIIIFFYSTLTMGFSMLFKKPKTAVLITSLILTITIFLFFIVRPFLLIPTLNGRTYFETYQFYHFDFGYHFMNIYAWFYETFQSDIPIGLQSWFVAWGVYKIEIDPLIPEDEILSKTNFITPQVSLLYVLVIAAVVMIIGFIIYKRRDIS